MSGATPTKSTLSAAFPTPGNSETKDGYNQVQGSMLKISVKILPGLPYRWSCLRLLRFCKVVVEIGRWDSNLADIAPFPFDYF